MPDIFLANHAADSECPPDSLFDIGWPRAFGAFSTRDAAMAASQKAFEQWLAQELENDRFPPPTIVWKDVQPAADDFWSSLAIDEYGDALGIAVVRRVPLDPA